MNMTEACPLGWYENASDEERMLTDMVYECGSMYEDMLFEVGTHSYNLIQCQALSPEGEWIDDEFGRPDELEYFSYSFFHFNVTPLEDEVLGYFNSSDQSLVISTEALNNKAVVLHEMIHLHEYVINELPMHYHDMLFWSLYTDLKKRIPELDEIISGHAHIIVEHSIYTSGGLHDILFLLKSFDLDIRMNYPLGTVFGYGRSDLFSEYTYNK